MIKQTHVDDIKKYLGDENLRYFKHLKGLKGEVFPVLRLNFKKRGIPIHPVHLREAMQIRNWMRSKYKEFKAISQDKLEELAIELVERAIV